MTDNIPMAKTCDICKEKYIGFGNNAWPLVDDGLCCDACNDLVLTARDDNMRKLSYRRSAGRTLNTFKRGNEQ